ncbi:MAG: VWA domain-containing protein [Phycisphaerales bacterium]|nr:VWA domain-containing protein [Phycisphaerales bacterium]
MKHSLRTLLFGIVSHVLSTITPAVHAQSLFVIGVPPRPTESEAVAITTSAIELARKASPGDRVRVIDAFRQQPVTEFTVPEARTERALLRELSAPIARLSAHFAESRKGGDEPDRRVHIPNFLDTVASVRDPGSSAPRILLFGSMYFGDGTDSRFDFAAGRYPSDGHILATSEHSVFGAADRRKLSGGRIDVMNLEPIVDDRDRFFVQRFWTAYAGERGVSLTSWQTDAGLAVEMVLRDIQEPLMHASLDRSDLRREIRRVAGPESLPNLWTLVVCIDASASMEEAFDQVRREVPRLAERLYDAGAEIRLCIIPYRQGPLAPFPVAPIRSSKSDGGRSIAGLRSYLDGVRLESSYVDPDAAVRRALDMLAADNDVATHVCLLVIGDTGPEVVGSPEHQLQLLRDLSEWREAGKGRSVQGVFLGGPGDPRVRYFEELSALSQQGIATGFEAIADRVVEQAADITRGTAGN